MFDNPSKTVMHKFFQIALYLLILVQHVQAQMQVPTASNTSSQEVVLHTNPLFAHQNTVVAKHSGLMKGKKLNGNLNLLKNHGIYF